MTAHDDNSPSGYRGATQDIDALVQHHLFLLCPNNSGSSFLQRALATCKATWNLVLEGQHAPGFAGPVPGRALGHIWASSPQWVDAYRHASSHDWVKTRQAWYFQVFSHRPDASVFTTKSPPLLLAADQLRQAFKGTRFLQMVRNPYACTVGIRRSRLVLGDSDNEAVLRSAARHLVAVFNQQLRNRSEHGDISEAFTYEQMCENPASVERQITRLLPALADINLQRAIPVKGIYQEPLTNMNDRQIAQLSARDLAVLNEEFAGSEELFRAFGYSLI